MLYMCMYVYVKIFGGTSTRAYTRTQARGTTPELRRVADTTSHGLAGIRYSATRVAHCHCTLHIAAKFINFVIAGYLLVLVLSSWAYDVNW